MTRSAVGFDGEVVARLDDDGWCDVPAGSTVTALRLGDYVAGPEGIEPRQPDLLVVSQTFASPGQMRFEVTFS